MIVVDDESAERAQQCGGRRDDPGMITGPIARSVAPEEYRDPKKAPARMSNAHTVAGKSS